MAFPAHPVPSLIDGAEGRIDAVDFELFCREAVLALAAGTMNFQAPAGFKPARAKITNMFIRFLRLVDFNIGGWPDFLLSGHVHYLRLLLVDVPRQQEPGLDPMTVFWS